jgi:hypothetical protein
MAPPVLKDLVGNDLAFYNSIVVPLVIKCADAEQHFGIAIELKEYFCGNVKRLEGYFVRLNAACHKHHHIQKDFQMDIDFNRLQIREVISFEWMKLKFENNDLLNETLANEIEREVKQCGQPKREHLITAFHETFDKLKKRENGTSNECNIVVFKLLCLGLLTFWRMKHYAAAA